MDTIEQLLETASDNGTFLGEGKSVKGAKYMAFKHDNRIFVGVYTSDNGEYICGAEEIPESKLSNYIIVS